MEKIFEALKTIKIKCHPNSNPSPIVDDALEIVEQALRELKQIKEAKPSEAMECLKVLEDCASVCGDYSHRVEPIKQSLLELQSIKESNPTEALKCLDTIEEFNIYNTNCNTMKDCCNYELNVIKQYILKAQENENVLEILKPYFQGAVFPSAIYFHFSYEEFEQIKRWVECLKN